MLNLNTDRLNAFHRVALDRNFTKAASALCISQSALSQRIQKLEEEIKTTLLIRRAEGVTLTESGRYLFDYVQAQIDSESEMLRAVKGHSGMAQGIVRIGAFSSVLRSVIMPAVRPLLGDGAAISIEFFCREFRELPAMLKSGEADFIIHEADQGFHNCIEVPLGQETLVHIRNKADNETYDENATPIFLDHDIEDMTTHRFFEFQGMAGKEFYRNFYDDVYGLFDGVKLGFGEAIISEHLVRTEDKIVVIDYPRSFVAPFSLYYPSNKVLTKLHKQVVDSLVKEVPLYL